MISSALVTGRRAREEALRGEINRSWAWMAGFGGLSWGMFLMGGIRPALRPPSELSVSVGQVRFLPPGTFYQIVPTPATRGGESSPGELVRIYGGSSGR